MQRKIYVGGNYKLIKKVGINVRALYQVREACEEGRISKIECS